MDDKLVIAVVAAISAVVGGFVSAVIGPFVKHRLEEASLGKRRKREQISKWRQMILDIDRAPDKNVSDHLQTHPDYITLEPFLTKEARRITHGRVRTIVAGQALSLPLETLKNEIARIESKWNLQK